MRCFTLSALFIAGFALTVPAQAELIQADWRIAGDQLAVMDTHHHRLWLDLSQTAGLSINEVKAQLATTYAGWRLPDAGEVETLFASAFGDYYIHPGYTAITLNKGQQLEDSAFVTLFGATYSKDGWPASFGLYAQDGNTMMAGANTGANMFYEDALRGTDFDYRLAIAGVYLVANVGDIVVGGSGGDPAAVSAPFTAGALLLAGLGWGARRRARGCKRA